MTDWRKTAKITADVVHFPYKATEKVKMAKEVYVWDLDKTYLDTKFETLKGLVRTAFEKPIEKRNLPGTATLVRSLRDHWLQQHPSTDFPIFFITASPPQIAGRVLEKLNLDGIQPYAIFCKDNLQNLRPKRLWRLTQQVGYKLQALLQMRLLLAEDVRQVLFGDDSESDAVIYSLYSDICARRLERSEVRNIMKSFRVVGQQMDAILDLQARVPNNDPVEKIYINLEDDTDSEYYIKFGRRTMPSFNSLQMAADLFQDGRLGVNQVVDVAQDMVANYGFTPEQIERSFDDLVRRRALGAPTVAELVPSLIAKNLLREDYKPSVEPREITQKVGDRVYELEGSFEPWVPERIDYMHDYR
ncbi:MAG: hypothetical protein H6626_07190 [Pseudobdellovibrionaceae bacterium]|nr:hypothetical protein [Bdellovibrionales bacterium]USN48865.1 MAG: hypothetical protein H6626_07190 [Pseudobdellovibrionaceae bacterium]